MDLLRAPLLGRLLRWRHARTLFQIPLLLLSVLMILHGFFGPSLAPKNLATTITWVHFRGALVLVLLVAGNFFCLACPFVLVRDFARRFFRPVRILKLPATLLVGEDSWIGPTWTPMPFILSAWGRYFDSIPAGEADCSASSFHVPI